MHECERAYNHACTHVRNHTHAPNSASRGEDGVLSSTSVFRASAASSACETPGLHACTQQIYSPRSINVCSHGIRKLMPAFGSAVEQRLRVPLKLDPPSTIFVFAMQAPHEPDKSATGPVCACTARYFDKLALGSRFLLHDALSAWPHPERMCLSAKTKAVVLSRLSAKTKAVVLSRHPSFSIRMWR